MEYYFLKVLYRVLDVLLDSYQPAVLAGSVVLGFWLGVTPVLTLHWLALFLFCILCRVNLSVTLVSAVLFSFLISFMDPFLFKLGYHLLTEQQNLIPIWTTFYQSPFLPLTRFNYPHIMGALAACLVATVPLYLVSYWFFRSYSTAIYEGWRGTRTFRMYQHYRRYIS